MGFNSAARMILLKLDIKHMQKNQGPKPYTIYKKYLKQVKDLSVRPKTIKFVEKKASGCWIWEWFLDHDTKILTTKGKIDKWDYIKLKNPWVSKETPKQKGNL